MRGDDINANAQDSAQRNIATVSDSVLHNLTIGSGFKPFAFNCTRGRVTIGVVGTCVHPMCCCCYTRLTCFPADPDAMFREAVPAPLVPEASASRE